MSWTKSSLHNTIKRLAGLIWMLAGPAVIILLIRTALKEILGSNSIDTLIQWSIFVLVFVPIAVGLSVFGWFAWKGAYDQLPRHSGELED